MISDEDEVNTVAIIGRPNVGKSTLFNALLRKRLAITHEQAGVTRDVKKHMTVYEDVEVTFLDTGGITDEGVLSDKISELSFSAVKQADVVILLVSVMEITGDDETLIQFIRQVDIPKLLVVNKVDNEEREWMAAEYYKFGLGNPIMVSSLHRRNIDHLWDNILYALGIDIGAIRAERKLLAERKKTDPFFYVDNDNIEGVAAGVVDDNIEGVAAGVVDDNIEGVSTEVVAGVEIADADRVDDEGVGDEVADVQGKARDASDKKEHTHFSGRLSGHLSEKQDCIRLLIMGKPNTGKSSLLNALLGTDRAMVSDIAGTTRDIIEEETNIFGQNLRLIDSAGIRRKNKIYDDVEYYSSHRAISAIDESDVIVLLIDVMDGLSEQDKKLASLIVRKGKGIVIGLNKWDLIEIKENRFQAEKDRLAFLVPQLQYAPLCALSSLQGKGLKELIKAVQLVYNQLYTHINTSHLNRNLQRWIERNPPRYIKRRQGKMKFIAQTSVNPVCFQVKVNNPDFFDESYKQYIVNNIRKQYSITNIPLKIDLITNK